jgi:hypothetical protein
MLATSGPTGATEAILLAHGFPAALLAGLTRNGLATGAICTVRAGARVIQVRRLNITNAAGWHSPWRCGADPSGHET